MRPDPEKRRTGRSGWTYLESPHRRLLVGMLLIRLLQGCALTQGLLASGVVVPWTEQEKAARLSNGMVLWTGVAIVLGAAIGRAALSGSCWKRRWTWAAIATLGTLLAGPAAMLAPAGGLSAVTVVFLFGMAMSGVGVADDWVADLLRTVLPRAAVWGSQGGLWGAAGCGSLLGFAACTPLLSGSLGITAGMTAALAIVTFLWNFPLLRHCDNPESPLLEPQPWTHFAQNRPRRELSDVSSLPTSEHCDSAPGPGACDANDGCSAGPAGQNDCTAGDDGGHCEHHVHDRLPDGRPECLTRPGVACVEHVDGEICCKQGAATAATPRAASLPANSYLAGVGLMSALLLLPTASSDGASMSPLWLNLSTLFVGAFAFREAARRVGYTIIALPAIVGLLLAAFASGVAGLLSTGTADWFPWMALPVLCFFVGGLWVAGNMICIEQIPAGFRRTAGIALMTTVMGGVAFVGRHFLTNWANPETASAAMAVVAAWITYPALAKSGPVVLATMHAEMVPDPVLR